MEVLKTLITGGTGFIGHHLRDLLLTEGIEPRLLTHKEWDAERDPFPASALVGIDSVVHLAGVSIASGRWSSERKRRIRDSRVVGTRRLMEAVAAAALPPRVVVAASAIGIYPEGDDEWLREDSPPAESFLGRLVQDWESSLFGHPAPEIRRVALRFGIVLGADGGALGQMLPIFRKGLGGPIGSGRQWMSWIEISDLCRMILFCLREERARGPLNAVAPQPVTNSEFTSELGRALKRPAVLRVPKLALRLAIGEMADYAAVSQRVSAGRIEALGFEFRYPELAPALKEMVRGN